MENDDNFTNNLTPEKLCNIIELEYQPEILNLCANINNYFSNHPFSKQIPLANSEIAYLLFIKLHDELKHLFLKETGIVFPCIIKYFTKHQLLMNENFLDGKVSEAVHKSQAVIIDLIEKIRSILNGFSIDSEWDKELKKCFARLFILETKILEWIHIEQKFLYPRVTVQNNTYFHNSNSFSIFSLN
jgi:hypothetical protein